MIVRYFKIILGDIRSNIGFYILLTVQTMIAFIIIGNLCGVTLYTNSTVNALDSFSFSDNYYGGIRTEVYTLNGVSVTEYDLSTERQLGYFIAENFVTEGYSNTFIEEDGVMYELNFVSENFFDIYDLEVAKGRLFEKSEYNSDSIENTPVILGSIYNGQYDIGDMYLGKYEVVGILNEGQQIINLVGELSQPFYVDSFVFLPVKSLKCMKENNFDYPTQLIYAEDKAELKAINDYAEELDIYPYNFVSLEGTKKIISILSKQTNIPMLVISAIIILLALLCLIQSEMLFVKKNISELLIHMICGARQLDIVIRISAGTLLVIALSVIVSSLLFMSAFTSAILSVVGLVTAAFAIIPTVIRLKLKPLISAVKEEK